MTIYYAIIFFIFGITLGSFYNVVAYRVPRGESIVFPASHCPHCNHKLTPMELIPIFSFLFQKGKCKNCRKKISWFYTIFELFTGILFTLSYLVYGLSWDLWIVLCFLSMLDIIIISDYQTLIIPDEVLIFFGILLSILLICGYGASYFFYQLIQGILSFGIMFLIKLLGDFLFKKESMGGGDIKLMFLFGLVLGTPLSLISIFLGSMIGLPISYFFMAKNKDHIIPFGPFLSIGAIILVLMKVDFNMILEFIL